jgi:uroporphyrinogen-III synthase
MASLIHRHGGEPTVAPSMQEVPLADNREALAFAEALLNGEIDVVIFLTGVGATALMSVAEQRHPRAELLAALDRCVTVVRGPKPAAVLRSWGVHIDHRAPEPNTWRELLGLFDDSAVDLSGKTVAVQEYGQPSDDLHAGLRARGGVVREVPVYSWKLPEDTAPLEAAVRATCERGFDVLLFTSAQQARHVLEVAERINLRDKWLAAAAKCVIGSIGPTCSEALHEAGLPVDLEPSHPKMGVLVREMLAAAPQRLAAGLEGRRVPSQ